MKRCFSVTCTGGVQTIMSQLGYVYHCDKDGRSCFHRSWNDARFPRFHVYAVFQNGILEIDIHIDALDPIEHKGNHGQQWAYEGGRLHEEVMRIGRVFAGTALAHVAGAERLRKRNFPKREIKNLIDLIFF